MFGNRENLPGILPGTYEFVCTPSQTAKDLFLYVEYIGHAFCNREYALIRSNYSYYLLMYVIRGSAVVHTEENSYIATPGQAFLISTSRPHIYGCLEDMEILWVHFNAKDFQPLFHHLMQTNQNQPVFSTSKTPDFSIKFSALIDGFKSPNPEPEIMISAHLYELIAMLSANCQITQFSPIDQAVHYINQHYAETISLNQLAETAHLSVSRFSMIFKQITNLSPYQYVIHTRLHAACQHLNRDSLSIEEIADIVGFSNAPALIHAFKKKYNITPLQFRKRAQWFQQNLSSD